ncbi:MAG: LPP20 family lipoprotein [Rubrivivax sp.]|nr:LPP20 family lipoprotein [Rubrivivax sp.]
MHSRRRFTGFLLALALSLPACAADKLPGWMTNPPQDDAQSWYGTGEGPDLEAARRLALRNVASKLRATIAGQVSNTTSVSSSGGKERVDVRALSAVTEEVAKTDFTRFEVAQSAKGGQGVYVLVKVDRPAFIADTRNQLQVVEKPVGEAEAALPRLSTLDQFLSLRRLKKQIEDGARLSMLLQGAGAEDEGRAGVRRFGGLMLQSNELASKLTFELRAGPADADLATALAAFLSEQGMRSAAGRTPGASPLTISADARQDELFGSKMVKMKVRLAVLDDQGRAAATREYELPGSSRYDFKGAREDAVRKFVDQLRKAGPVAALGFKD